MIFHLVAHHGLFSATACMFSILHLRGIVRFASLRKVGSMQYLQSKGVEYPPPHKNRMGIIPNCSQQRALSGTQGTLGAKRGIWACSGGCRSHVLASLHFSLATCSSIFLFWVTKFLALLSRPSHFAGLGSGYCGNPPESTTSTGSTWSDVWSGPGSLRRG